jgi:Transketolase, thiamine diphosphate binding domain
MQTVERMDLDRLAVDTVRVLAMDAIQKAGSGHPGTAMALALLMAPDDWMIGPHATLVARLVDHRKHLHAPSRIVTKVVRRDGGAEHRQQRRNPGPVEPC